MTTISTLDLARQVTFSDQMPSVEVLVIQRILDIALRTKIGMTALSSEGVTVDLGNGYNLHCKTKKIGEGVQA